MTTGKRLLSKVAPYAHLFSAVGSEYRIAILYLLIEKSRTPSEIAPYLRISQPLVVHHLSLLKKSGWVGTERIGLHVFYSVKKSTLRQLIAFAKKFS
jgi:DNA-binding transcriptional ArsR family regulator